MTQGELFRARVLPVTGAVTFDPYLPRIEDDASERLAAEALRIAAERGQVCADDLHGIDLCGRDSRIIGAVLRRLAQAGQLASGEMVLSKRRECHHRPIRMFMAKAGAA